MHSTTTIWYTNFLMPQALKIPDAETADEKHVKKWRKYGMAADESQKQKEVIDEARNEGTKVHVAS